MMVINFITPSIIVLAGLFASIVVMTERRFLMSAFCISLVTAVSICFTAFIFVEDISLKMLWILFILYFTFGIMVFVLFLTFLPFNRRLSIFTQPILALFLLISVNFIFLSSSLIERFSSNLPVRNAVIDTSLRFNPAVISSAWAFKTDVLRQKIMYSKVSAVGGFFPYSYPSVASTVTSYIAISLIFFALHIAIKYLYYWKEF